MTSLTFDTLQYVDKLVQAGVPDIQARTQASTLAEVLKTAEKELVTKQDLETALLRFENNIKNELNPIKNEQISIKGELNLLKWMTGAMLAIAVANFTKQYF